MFAYWLMFFLPALQAVSRLRVASPPRTRKQWPTMWRLVFLLLALMIGLRHEVGGDWSSYMWNFEVVANQNFIEALTSRSDPGDTLLNWFAANTGLGIYLVNCVYGTLFTWGLLVFCQNQTRPWLALTVAVPYLITVVAMGYSRQGVAIGIVMLGLVALENKSIFKFVLSIALAAAFHKSAVIMLPLAVLVGTRRRLWTLFWLGAVTALLFVLMLQEYVDSLVAGYIGEKYESSGATIRVSMNALPATVFLLFRRRFNLTPAQLSFWTWMAWGALAFILLLFLSPSSTAVDRVALYWIPLQLFVWSRFPDAMGKSGKANAGWVYMVVGYSWAAYFVWLFYSNNSVSWLPYQFYPWVWLWR